MQDDTDQPKHLYPARFTAYLLLGGNSGHLRHVAPSCECKGVDFACGMSGNLIPEAYGFKC